MTSADVDAYLAALDEPKRSTLIEVRRRILEIIPEAEQVISYGVPAFKVRGKAVAGFAAFTNHLTYAPHSGTVLAGLGDDLKGYVTSKGSFRFPVDEPLPSALLETLIAARMAELARP